MRSKAIRPVLRKLLIGLAGAGCLWLLLGPTAQRWHVDRNIARFARNPSQARASALVELLQCHAATTEQGQRILTLLRLPKISTRRTYPAGLPVMIAIERPFHLDFRGVLSREEKIRIDGLQRHHQYSSSGGEQPEVLYLRGLGDAEAKPGTHEVTIQGTYSIGLERQGVQSNAGRHLRSVLHQFGLSVPKIWQPTRTYECEFEVPVEVTVVPKAEAEPIELVSSAHLDKAMRKAFSVGRTGIYSSIGPASSADRSNPVKAIFYKDLPMAVAFRLDLYLSDGQELAPSVAYTKRIRCRAGDSGMFVLPLAKPLAERPGTHTYTGTAVLTPDPNAAYEDPAIEAIWNGEIELPISLKIRGP
jgi:hypothetical protein